MKKSLSHLAFILGLSVIIFSGCTTKKSTTSMTEKPQTDGATSELANDQPIVNNSRYFQFNPKVLDESKGTRRVLFFYANWCPTCKSANESFINNASQIPEDVTLIRVNYNDTDTDQIEKDLAKKYGITYQHTFVQLDGSGNNVAIWNGGEIDELISRIK